MIKSKKILSMLLAVMMVLSMLSCFATGVASAEAGKDKFVFRPFKVVDSTPRFSTTVSTGIVFICNATSWKNAKDGEFVYIDYGVNPGDKAECYKLVKGENAFSDVTTAMSAASTATAYKFGPGTYEEKVKVERNGITFYGNFAGINPNADFDSLETFYDVPQNPLRTDSSLETVIVSTWNWQRATSYIVCDGFTLSAKGQFFASYSGGSCSNNAFYNNIFTGNTTYAINCDYGSNYNTIVKYNRLVDSSASVVLLFGAGFYNLDLQYNYFGNLTGSPIRMTSIGNNSGTESQLNFSNNIFNNVAGYVNFEMDHSHGGVGNFMFYRFTDNIVYGCGSSSGKFVSINYHPDQSGSYDPNVDQMDPGSKTFIANNEFYSIPSGVVPVKLNGANTIKTKTFFYRVSVTENRFLFASPEGGKAISCSITGALDASKNFYGECSAGIGKEKIIANAASAVDATAATQDVITKPYYLNYEKTTLSAVVTLQPGNEADITAAGFVANGITVNNANMQIVANVAEDVESVDLKPIVKSENTTFKFYKDFLLTNELENGLLDLVGDQTLAYVIASNSFSGSTSVYTISVMAKTDKSLAQLKKVIYTPDDTEYQDVTFDGTDITVHLDTDMVYFPFNFVVSPSASYQIFTDEKCSQEYTGNWYMQPDKPTVFYVIVTSGAGKALTKYKLTFNRTGSNNSDASILSAITPEQNIMIYNNERNRVTYRPHIMATDVVFEFNVTDNATYTIYEDEAMTKVLSTKEKPQAISVPDAISYFYIKVKSIYGYERNYTFVMYNDVKSTDNTVYGVTGLDNVEVTDDTITIYASNTLAVVNAHFDTNVFADVKLYADEDKTFAIEPNLSYITVNKREVEVRTFQLGNTTKTSYFYLTVTSETGVARDYLVKLVKLGVEGATDFADVSAKHWAKKYIDSASSIGIVAGQLNEGNGKYYFNPDNNITRQEVAAMLCNMMGITPYSFRGVAIGEVFKDASAIPEWSYNYIKAVYALKAMVGDTNGNFRFEDNITREEFFVSIAGILKLDKEAAGSQSLAQFSDSSKVSSWAVSATKALVKEGILKGSNGKLNPKDKITRAEAITIIAQCHKLTK